MQHLMDPLEARALWHLQIGYPPAGQWDEFEIEERCQDDFHEPTTCWNCGGEGFVIVCCDDLCHGAGYCFHGDGHAMCLECQGEGVL